MSYPCLGFSLYNSAYINFRDLFVVPFLTQIIMKIEPPGIFSCWQKYRNSSSDYTCLQAAGIGINTVVIVCYKDPDQSSAYIWQMLFHDNKNILLGALIHGFYRAIYRSRGDKRISAFQHFTSHNCLHILGPSVMNKSRKMRSFIGQKSGHTTYTIFQRTKTWWIWIKTVISNAFSRIKIVFTYQTLIDTPNLASQSEIWIGYHELPIERWCLTCIKIPIIKIRRSDNYFIFMIEPHIRKDSPSLKQSGYMQYCLQWTVL